MKTISQPEKLLVREALDDLKARTLSMFAGKIARLIYLASLRDYNTGRYYHAGLTDQFGEEAACEALKRAHQTAFYQLATSSVEDVLLDLATHVQSLAFSSDEVYEAWSKLGAYNVILPMDCDPLARQLYSSSLSCALAILQVPPARPSDDGQPNALPLP